MLTRSKLNEMLNTLKEPIDPRWKGVNFQSFARYLTTTSSRKEEFELDYARCRKKYAKATGKDKRLQELNEERQMYPQRASNINSEIAQITEEISEGGLEFLAADLEVDVVRDDQATLAALGEYRRQKTSN